MTIRPVNYINEIFIDEDKITSVVINEECLIGYFDELINRNRCDVVLILIIPTNDHITNIIRSLTTAKRFKSITYTKAFKFVSENSELFSLINNDDADIFSLNNDKLENINIKMIRKDIFKDRIDSFIKLTIRNLDIKRMRY